MSALSAPSLSARRSCRSRRSRIQPRLERRLALARCAAGDEALDAYIFVDGFPMNPSSLGYEAPLPPFFTRETTSPFSGAPFSGASVATAC